MCDPASDVRHYRALRDTGSTRAQLREALACGRLRRVRRGVYATDAACVEVVSAAAAGGPIACISAARHAGLWVLGADAEVHVWLSGHGHRRCGDEAPSGCVPHWDAGDRVGFGPPSVPRVLRQILACAGAEVFFVALESARRLRLIDAAGLRWLHAHTNEDGREALRLSRDDADSGLESLVRWRLRSHRLRVRTQVRITGVGVVDLLIGDRLIIETDGRANHEGESHRHKDLRRDAHATIWGYVTLRFDYAMIVHEWDLVEDAILAAVAQGRHLVP